MKRLYRNEPLHIDEWRVLSALGRVVVDEELSDDTIALDQTLRNALGMRMNLIQNVRVKLCRAEGTLARWIRSRFDNGQYLFLRVNYPALNDMEKRVVVYRPTLLSCFDPKMDIVYGWNTASASMDESLLAYWMYRLPGILTATKAYLTNGSVIWCFRKSYTLIQL